MWVFMQTCTQTNTGCTSYRQQKLLQDIVHVHVHLHQLYMYFTAKEQDLNTHSSIPGSCRYISCQMDVCTRSTHHSVSQKLQSKTTNKKLVEHKTTNKKLKQQTRN